MTSYLDPGALAGIDSVLQPIRFLCEALGRTGQIRLLQEFTGGYTGARVFLAEQQVSPGDPQPFRLVFKVGPSKLLRDEVERYQVLLSHARAHKAFAPILEPKKTLETLPPGDSLGAIVYEHAAAAFGRRDCISLKDLVGQAIQGTAPLSEVEEVVATAVQAIGSLYANPEEGFAVALAKYYLDRWAPDFRVAVDEAVDLDGRWLLTRRRLNSARFWEEPETYPAILRQSAETLATTPQIEVVIRMLSPVYTSGATLFVHGPTSDVISLEIDLSALSPEVRERVAASRILSLWTSVQAEGSKFSFYRRRLQEAWPEVDLTHPVLHFGQRRFHNPLYHLSRPLQESALPLAKTRLVPAHGDLHPGNVLVVGNMPVIIDYGLSELRVPVGTDSVRLLGGVIRDVLSELLTLEDLTSVIFALLELEPPPSDLTTLAGRAWRLLDRLQKGTAKVSGSDAAALWPLHLLGYAFIGLKWPADSAARHSACGLLAAAALVRVLGWPEPEQETKTAPPQEIRSEGPAEILILVAKFAGTAEYEPTARIYGALADHLFEVIPEIGRVERIDEVVSSRKKAVELAKSYQASMVVWGTYDGLGIRPRYEVTRDSLAMKKSMIQLDQTTRHQLKEQFDIYITDNLANEVSFLSLQAVGHMCELNLNHQAAVGVYERALALIPSIERAKALGASEVYQSLAGIYSVLRRYEDALSANARALELNPNDFLSQLQLVQLRAISEKRTNVELVENFRELVNKHIAYSPKGTEEHEGLERVLEIFESIRSPQDLKRIFEEVGDSLLPTIDHRKFSKDVVVHLTRAANYLQNKQSPRALREFRLALRLNPRCAPALTGRALALADLDRLSEAIRDLQKAEKIDPAQEIIYTIRALVFLYQKKPAEALFNIERAYEMGVPRSRFIGTWGESMLDLGRGDELMITLKNLKVDPANTSVFRIRSMYYRNREQYNLALHEIEQAILLDSDAQLYESYNFEERSKVYSAMGCLDLALEDARRAIDASQPGTIARRKAQELLQDLIDGSTNPPHSSLTNHQKCS